ncbi:hypothetical protein DUI87_02999 [Hirundo rustica rustica]|uniref:CCHC-type domain-containing protein n=1 Tax=Hirundo rustica rustica TaxID=333673 RepID=A0A3M0LAT4_HIRRU|nr:hypothetical protein DUI87_02999 [Hirundo rustica rustica]
MIEAYSWIVTSEEKATYLAEAMATALKPLVQGRKSGNSTCFNWDKTGHIKKQWKIQVEKKNKARATSTGFPGNCNRCGKFGHLASKCKSRCSKDGKQSTNGGCAMAQMHPQNQVASWTSSATPGSAGVDVETAIEVNLNDTDVQVVPSTANGPLEHGLSALQIGRTSTSKQGLFVLPGLIDADYLGNIGIMVQTL